MAVQVLSSFQFSRNCQAVMLSPGSEKLVAFLALNRQTLRRRYVASLLWIDEGDDRAAARLRSAIWRLRVIAPDALEVDNHHIRLADCVSIDLTCAELLAYGLMQDDLPLPELGAERVLGCDLLPDWYDEWVPLPRERYRQLRLHALEALCQRLTKLGFHSRAVETGLLAVGGEPLRESAQAVLIRAYLAEGNRSRALIQFETYRRTLWEELALHPSPQIEELVRFR
jgi:DNA-binding SARP family transcriptional activator